MQSTSRASCVCLHTFSQTDIDQAEENRLSTVDLFDCLSDDVGEVKLSFICIWD